MTTQVTSPDEFEEKLEEKMRNFMEDGETFNVQGTWTGEDGIQVHVLVDYGIESPDGNGYVGSVWARKAENPNLTMEEYKESDTVLDAENALTSAIHSVFKIPYDEFHYETLESDVDFGTTFHISHGFWEVR